MGEMRILNSSGDQQVIWDPTRDAEVSAAKETFKALKEKGYQAYAVKKNGDKGEIITEFDADAGKIIMAPKMKGG